MATTTTKHFKIRKQGTDLYSSGGGHPQWKKKGKTWTNIGHVKLHLQEKAAGLQRWHPTSMADYTDAEVVEYEVTITETKVTPLDVIAKAAVEAKAEKDRKRQEQIDQIIRDRELKQLQDLKRKYPGT